MKINTVMTPLPYTINAESSVQEGLREMELNKIQHLPVVKGGELIGVLAESVVRMSVSFSENSGAEISVGRICETEPYVVDEQAEVSMVAKEMADNKCSCALVAGENENLVGIFTATDACRLIFRMLSEEQAK